MQYHNILNNILSNNGGYGINLNFGSAAANELVRGFWDYNDFYNNTLGARHNLNAGANDKAINPSYVNAAGGNYIPTGGI